MNDQREYDEWFRRMIATHCPGLFAEMAVREYRGTEYIEAVIPHPSASRRKTHVFRYGVPDATRSAGMVTECLPQVLLAPRSSR
jgi:hypothetical protein